MKARAVRSQAQAKRGRPAAEVYAEVGEGRPRCACHGELMNWNQDAGCRCGGYWKCVVIARAASRRHGRSEQGRIWLIRYRASEEGKAKVRATNARYEASHIRSMAGGRSTRYRVDPEKRAELVALLADFRSGLKQRYREEIGEWLEPLDSPAS